MHVRSVRARAVETAERPQETDDTAATQGIYGMTVQDLARFAEELAEQGEGCSVERNAAERLAERLYSSLTSGLASDADELARRAAALGSNSLPERDQVSFGELLGRSLEDFTLRVLLAAGALSLVLEGVLGGEAGGWVEGAAILAAVAVVALVTATNDYQKERQFRALSALSSAANVTVLRDGRTQEIDTGKLVVGDVMLFDTGDILPADGMLFQGNEIRADESHLTGESEDVLKRPGGAALMLSGAKVLEGYGRMVVTAVGLNSAQGQILGSLGGATQGAPGDGLRETTALQRKLEGMAGQIGGFGLAAALLSLAAMAGQFSWAEFVVAGRPWAWELLPRYLHFVITAITIVVVAVPEGLPLAVTVALAFSVKRMLSENNLVRTLSAAETMGAATTICTDKTGTLTQNEMAVVRMWAAGSEFRDLAALREAAPCGNGAPGPGLALDAAVVALITEGIAVNSTAELRPSPDGGRNLQVGNRTECALLTLAAGLGANYAAARARHQQAAVAPFSSERKRMSTLAVPGEPSGNGASGARLYCKGAAEIVLRLCTRRLLPDGRAAELPIEEMQELLESFSTDGNRMLALAYRDVPNAELPEEGPMCGAEEVDVAGLEAGLVLVALVGIEDPLRREVPEAIRQCQRAGITVRMLTGDNAVTAAAIARQCGILPPDAPLPYLTPVMATMDEPAQASAASDAHSAPADSASSAHADHARSGAGPASSSGRGGAGAASSSRAAGRGLRAALWGELDRRAEGRDEGRGNRADRSGAGCREGSAVMTGPEFRKQVLRPDGSLDREAFMALWPSLRVMGRCSPNDKYTIVQALQGDSDEVVAMTGDGTNDAPALRLADVGFAMNSGTSIAKEASDILLLDDNFASVVSAVRWGRNVYAGITKFLQFQLVVNVVAVATAAVGAFALQESPLTAVQMLWVNLIMDSLASLALATEAPTDAVLDLPPYSPSQPLLTPSVLKSVAGQSVFQLAVMCVLVFHGDALFGVPAAASLQGPSAHYTLVFNAFVMMQLFNQVNARKIYDEPNVLAGVLDNRLFLGILGSELLLQALIVQFGGEVFATQPLSAEQWGACVGIGALSLLVRAVLCALPPHPRAGASLASGSGGDADAE
ncbi:hypothetical protein WJX81_005835 [Elliptochloris bilobata]|uniref:P-type Ca(2+) transporter n=1 Tax=Elliptochloris bilobata TaxID=381761 RepID=A0AAW1SIR2_9CHLO